MKLIDLAGQRFGRLTVIGRAPNKVIRTYLPGGDSYLNWVTMWHCKCDCGNEKDIESQSLRLGRTRSCGCYRKEARHAKAKLRGAASE